MAVVTSSAVAPDLAAGLASPMASSMSFSSASEAAAVDGVLRARADVDERRVRDDVGALQAGQLDDLLDQTGQPARLDADARRRSAATASGSSCGVEHGLGEQGDAADGGLELVADVGEEVAPDLLDAARLERSSTSSSTWSPPSGATRAATTSRAVTDALAQVELDLADHPVAPHRPGEVEQLRVDELLAAHESLGDGGRRVVDDPVGASRRRCRSSGARRAPRRRPGGRSGGRRDDDPLAVGAVGAGARRAPRRRRARGRRCRPSVAAVVGSTTLRVRIRVARSDQPVPRHAAAEPSVHLQAALHSRWTASLGHRTPPARTARDEEDHARPVPRGPRHDLGPARRADPARGVRHVPRHDRPARCRRAPRRVGHRGRQASSTTSASSSTSCPSTCSPASSRSPPTCASSSPSMHMSSDLERMGDLARHVAKVARLRHPDSAVPPELRSHILQMGQVAEAIVAKCGSIIASKDVDGGDRAREGRRRDGRAAPRAVRRAARRGQRRGRAARPRPDPRRPLLRAVRRPRRVGGPARHLPRHR